MSFTPLAGMALPEDSGPGSTFGVRDARMHSGVFSYS